MQTAISDTGPRRYLVYTSAGDHANIGQWLAGERHFDLWVTYYGTRPGRYANLAEYYETRQGGKFPNLWHAYNQHRAIFARYEAILVADDDVIINTRALNDLFRLRAVHDLWVTQPAFNPRGKSSWPITVRQPGKLLRYTNFVEMTCPLFRNDKLFTVLDAYDPALTGVGVDWWFIHTLGAAFMNRYAIIDAVSCTNPIDSNKREGREVLKVQSIEAQQTYWHGYRRAMGIEPWTHRVHSHIASSRAEAYRQWLRYAPAAVYRSTVRHLRRTRATSAHLIDAVRAHPLADARRPKRLSLRWRSQAS